MERAEGLLNLPVRALLEQVASPGAESGAGAVTALCGALAGALLVAIAESSRESWPGAAGSGAQAQALSRRSAALVDENAGAYGAALDLLTRSRRGEGVGDRALADALETAAAVPLQIAETAAAVADLAAEVAAHGSADHRADAQAAAGMAAAAARAAGGLVEVNLTVGPEDPRIELARTLASAARSAEERARAAGE